MAIAKRVIPLSYDGKRSCVSLAQGLTLDEIEGTKRILQVPKDNSLDVHQLFSCQQGQNTCVYGLYCTRRDLHHSLHREEGSKLAVAERAHQAVRPTEALQLQASCQCCINLFEARIWLAGIVESLMPC